MGRVFKCITKGSGIMTSLRQVLDRLRSAKLTAKPSKCLIGYSSIECLGHIYRRSNIETARGQDTGY